MGRVGSNGYRLHQESTAANYYVSSPRNRVWTERSLKASADVIIIIRCCPPASSVLLSWSGPHLTNRLIGIHASMSPQSIERVSDVLGGQKPRGQQRTERFVPDYVSLCQPNRQTDRQTHSLTDRQSNQWRNVINRQQNTHPKISQSPLFFVGYWRS